MKNYVDDSKFDPRERFQMRINAVADRCGNRSMRPGSTIDWRKLEAELDAMLKAAGATTELVLDVPTHKVYYEVCSLGADFLVPDSNI